MEYMRNSMIPGCRSGSENCCNNCTYAADNTVRADNSDINDGAPITWEGDVGNFAIVSNAFETSDTDVQISLPAANRNPDSPSSIYKIRISGDTGSIFKFTLGTNFTVSVQLSATLGCLSIEGAFYPTYKRIELSPSVEYEVAILSGPNYIQVYITGLSGDNSLYIKGAADTNEFAMGTGDTIGSSPSRLWDFRAIYQDTSTEGDPSPAPEEHSHCPRQAVPCAYLSETFAYGAASQACNVEEVEGDFISSGTYLYTEDANAMAKIRTINPDLRSAHYGYIDVYGDTDGDEVVLMAGAARFIAKFATSSSLHSCNGTTVTGLPILAKDTWHRIPFYVHDGFLTVVLSGTDYCIAGAGQPYIHIGTITCAGRVRYKELTLNRYYDATLAPDCEENDCEPTEPCLFYSSGGSVSGGSSGLPFCLEVVSGTWDATPATTYPIDDGHIASVGAGGWAGGYVSEVGVLRTRARPKTAYQLFTVAFRGVVASGNISSVAISTNDGAQRLECDFTDAISSPAVQGKLRLYVNSVLIDEVPVATANPHGSTSQSASGFILSICVASDHVAGFIGGASVDWPLDDAEDGIFTLTAVSAASAGEATIEVLNAETKVLVSDIQMQYTYSDFGDDDCQNCPPELCGMCTDTPTRFDVSLLQTVSLCGSSFAPADFELPISTAAKAGNLVRAPFINSAKHRWGDPPDQDNLTSGTFGCIGALQVCGDEDNPGGAAGIAAWFYALSNPGTPLYEVNLFVGFMGWTRISSTAGGGYAYTVYSDTTPLPVDCDVGEQTLLDGTSTPLFTVEPIF